MIYLNIVLKKLIGRCFLAQVARIYQAVNPLLEIMNISLPLDMVFCAFPPTDIEKQLR